MLTRCIVSPELSVWFWGPLGCGVLVGRLSAEVEFAQGVGVGDGAVLEVVEVDRHGPVSVEDFVGGHGHGVLRPVDLNLGPDGCWSGSAQCVLVERAVGVFEAADLDGHRVG